MWHRILNAALALALAALWLFVGLTRRDDTRRNYDFMPDMARSLAFEAQRECPHLDGDGNERFLPPAGSIARGFMPLPYKATPEDAERAGKELQNPFKGEDANLKRGEFIFLTYCRVCHGNEGLGDGTITKNGFPAPPSLMGEKAMTMPDGKMFHILTYGQNNMPSYATQILRDDRWKAILYVRSLQKPKPAPPIEPPAKGAAPSP